MRYVGKAMVNLPAIIDSKRNCVVTIELQERVMSTSGNSTLMGSDAGGAQVTLEEQGKYALEHFKYLADQRMKTFNYYAILVAAAITGSVAAYDKCPWYMIAALGVIHCAMAYIFLMIDIRNCLLVFNARRALRSFEERAQLPEPMRVITNDLWRQGHDAVSAAREEADRDWSRRYKFRNLICRCMGRDGATYTAAFNLGFFAQTSCGLLLIAAAVFLKR